jgi:hypothetical protein
MARLQAYKTTQEQKEHISRVYEKRHDGILEALMARLQAYNRSRRQRVRLEWDDVRGGLAAAESDEIHGVLLPAH